MPRALYPTAGLSARSGSKRRPGCWPRMTQTSLDRSSESAEINTKSMLRESAQEMRIDQDFMPEWPP